MQAPQCVQKCQRPVSATAEENIVEAQHAAQREAQRASNTERARQRRANITEEEREALRTYNRNYQRTRRAQMTEVQRAHQREVWRETAKRRRTKQSIEDDRAERQTAQLQSCNILDAQQTLAVPSSNNQTTSSHLTRELQQKSNSRIISNQPPGSHITRGTLNFFITV